MFALLKPLSLRQFALLLAALLALLAIATPPRPDGDFEEYAAMTAALAAHATPAIRAADLQTAAALAPAVSAPYAILAEGMRKGLEIPRYGFNRGRNGGYFAIHFFAYPALAALPFRLLQAGGMDPLRCFQLVNLGFVWLLGLCLFRLFGSSAKASAGVVLFMLCGGALYWNWSSPECMSAAALLSGLILFSTGAPLAGGLLAGLAAMQNPPVGLFFGFAPLLQLALHYDPQQGWRAAVRNALRLPNLLGMLAVLALALVPIAFSLWQFGVPSLIAKYSTDRELIGAHRLVSFFFDLNQGMLIGVPALLAALLFWGWRRQPVRNLIVLGLSCVFVAALAVPALSAQNWNSGASGMMRYAFWGAMPLLFAFLLRLRDHARWPQVLVAAVALGQLMCTVTAQQYGYLELSPLARVVLAHAPGLYNPDPEIFNERVTHDDHGIGSAGLTVYGGKTMYAPADPNADFRLCGRGRMVSPASRTADAGQDFRYINGPVLCTLSNKPGPALATFGSRQFGENGVLNLQAGWGKPELGGGVWDGVWSDGKRSRLTLTVAPGQQVRWVGIAGHYGEGNKRTRVTIDGADLGWRRLDHSVILPLTGGENEAGRVVTIELEHEAPAEPAGAQDPRRLAFFMHTVSLH